MTSVTVSSFYMTSFIPEKVMIIHHPLLFLILLIFIIIWSHFPFQEIKGKRPEWGITGMWFENKQTNNMQEIKIYHNLHTEWCLLYTCVYEWMKERNILQMHFHYLMCVCVCVFERDSKCTYWLFDPDNVNQTSVPSA